MGIEIERKYLVTGDGWRTAAHAVIPMAQGYLTGSDPAQKASVRVRVQGDEAYLNIKSRERGHTRQEFDYPVPVDEARALLALSSGGLVDKRRHLVQIDGLLWEVDEFLGANAGLIVAEVELEHAEQAITLPDWVGAEVTDDLRYYNNALADHPYRDWADAAR